MSVNVTAKLATLVRSIAEGLVVVSNNSLGDEGSEVVRIAPADTLNSQSNVGSGHIIITNTDIRANEVGLLLGELVGSSIGAMAGETREVLLSKLDKLLMRDATGAYQDHAIGSVVVLDIVGKFGSGDITDVLARTKNSAAERLLLESGGMEVIENDLLNLLLNFLGLTENYIALTLDGGLLELGVLQNIGEDIDALRNIGVEGLSEVDGVLALDLLLVDDNLITPRIGHTEV